MICAFGRLGSWWGAEYAGVRPDLITFAKGVTSGYLPLGGVLVGPAVRGPWKTTRQRSSGTATPTAAIRVARPPPLPTSTSWSGNNCWAPPPGLPPTLGRGLQGLVDGEAVAEVRGTMGIWALGLGTGVDATALRDALLTNGIIARPIGASTVAFCPSLVITDAEMEECVEGTRQALEQVT